MPHQGLLIAVDGPAGTGKSTVCRAVAQRLEAKYLDTGAMYRVATLQVLRHGIDPSDTAAVIAATAALPLEISSDSSVSTVLLDGEDVTDVIRTAEINRNVSAVSAVPEVRKALVALQRSLALQAGRCVVEGRDIGTVVLADAPLKVFLTASDEVRARRRYEQDKAAGREVEYSVVLADTRRRDALDASRTTSPALPAEDAIVVDTSELGLEEVIDQLIALAEQSAERTATR